MCSSRSTTAGTPELTGRALDIARDERIKITFFPVGAELQKTPALWRRAIIEGHSIENHTQWHLPLPQFTDARIRWELEEAGRQLNAVLGYEYPQRFMRPPEGAGIPDSQGRLTRLSQATGLHIAMWSADSQGWHYPRDGGAHAQDHVLGNLADHLKPGAILLLHALASDIAALPRLAREIHSAGLQSVNPARSAASPRPGNRERRPPLDVPGDASRCRRVVLNRPTPGAWPRRSLREVFRS